jgi:putative NADPH-quinone reductase
MDTQRIVLIQGHPDPLIRHLGHALADAYAQGAQAGGHEVRQIDVARLDFPLLRTQQDWTSGNLPTTLQAAQNDIGWAQHLVLFFPLWLGDMPALLKGFLEQVARPGFAFKAGEGGNPFERKGLAGSISSAMPGSRNGRTKCALWVKRHLEGGPLLERMQSDQVALGVLHQRDKAVGANAHLGQTQRAAIGCGPFRLHRAVDA